MFDRYVSFFYNSESVFLESQIFPFVPDIRHLMWGRFPVESTLLLFFYLNFYPPSYSHF